MNYKKLKVYKKSHQLTLEVYEKTSTFPKSEIYGLINQMRRAASSIPMNIAEGAQSISDQMFVKHLGIARGSSAELEYQLTLAKDLNYLNKADVEYLTKDLEEILRMLNGLMRSIKDSESLRY